MEIPFSPFGKLTRAAMITVWQATNHEQNCAISQDYSNVTYFHRCSKNINLLPFCCLFLSMTTRQVIYRFETPRKGIYLLKIAQKKSYFTSMFNACIILNCPPRCLRKISVKIRMLQLKVRGIFFADLNRKSQW